MNIPFEQSTPHYNSGNGTFTNLLDWFKADLNGTNSNDELISLSVAESNITSIEIEQQSSDNILVLWAIVCPVFGAPCSIMFLYVLYRGIEVKLL